MRIKLGPASRRDMSNIWDYGDGQFGINRADAYLDDLALRVVWLRQNRGLWKTRSDLGRDLFCYPHEKHIIYFRHAKTDIIEIVRILHQQMDAIRHI